MTIRKTAHWQWSIDDRILEHLRDESWSTASRMARLPNMHATEAQVQERCRMLADADLVAFLTADEEIVELTTWGNLYLKGEIDAENRHLPRHPKSMSKGKN